MTRNKQKQRKKGKPVAKRSYGPRKPHGEAKRQAGIRIYPSDLAKIVRVHGSLQQGVDYLANQIKDDEEKATPIPGSA